MTMFSRLYSLAFATTLLASTAPAPAAPIILTNSQSARVVFAGDSRDDNNGGADVLVIGINNQNINNFVILRFDLSGYSASDIVGDGTLELTPGIINQAVKGSSADTIAIYKLFPTNIDWQEGTGIIGATDNLTNDGSASFLNRVQFNDHPGPPSGTSLPWYDAAGNPVANLLGAFDPMPFSTIPGWDAEPSNVTITIPHAILVDWIENGNAGMVIASLDNGDLRGRFNFDGSSNVSRMPKLYINVVPEPASLVLVGIGGLFLSKRRTDKGACD